MNVDKLKRHLRISDMDTEDDTYLQECLDRATAKVKTACDIDIDPTQYEANFAFEQPQDEIKIDKSGVSGIVSVEYLNEDNEFVVAGTNDYEVYFENGLAHIVLASGDDFKEASDDYPLSAKVAYIRSLVKGSDVYLLAEALILDEAANLYTNPGYAMDAIIRRNPRVMEIKRLVSSFQSYAKYTT